MSPHHFLEILSTVDEVAFRVCETAITLTFIWVYGRLAIRHILAMLQKENNDRVTSDRRGDTKASR
jgi:hypothetical protein